MVWILLLKKREGRNFKKKIKMARCCHCRLQLATLLLVIFPRIGSSFRASRSSSKSYIGMKTLLQASISPSSYRPSFPFRTAANPASTSPSALPDNRAATIGVAMRGGKRPRRSWRPWRARTLSSISTTEAGGNGSGDVRELLKLAGERIDPLH